MEDKKTNENENENTIITKKPIGRPRVYENNNRLRYYETRSKEYQKKYYEKNKEKLLNNQKQKVKCEVCKKEVMKCNFLKHQRSNKCVDNIHKLIERYFKMKLIKEELKDDNTIKDQLREIFKTIIEDKIE
jgi:hypothetical protein